MNLVRFTMRYVNVYIWNCPQFVNSMIDFDVILFFFKDFPGTNPVTVEAAQKFARDNRALNYTELSQAIHPILGTPYLYLHPCMTQQLLEIMQKR